MAAEIRRILKVTSLSRLAGKAGLYAWGFRRLVQLGRPDVALGFLGGIGDDLLCTAPVEEWLQRGARRIWFFTRHPSLYSHYDRRVRLVPEDGRHQHLARRLMRPMFAVSYSDYDPASDRDLPPREHVIAAICRRAGLSGRVHLRPRLDIAAGEIARVGDWSGRIAVHTSSMAASVPMLNKQWPPDRFQAVIDHFSGRSEFVQIGSREDPPLRGVEDLRGRTSLRETAAILAQARLLVGLVGFPMHLARAVDCPAVVVYGGRELPEITGYPCNINLVRNPSCSPCWRRNRCDRGRECLDAVTAGDVIAAIERSLAMPRSPLATEIAEL